MKSGKSNKLVAERATPIADPVTKAELRIVHRLACEVANVSASGDLRATSKLSAQLRQHVRRLEQLHPDDYRLLATRADYCLRKASQMELWQQVYKRALRKRDRLNAAMASGDIALALLQDAKVEEAVKWRSKFCRLNRLVYDSYLDLVRSEMASLGKQLGFCWK